MEKLLSWLKKYGPLGSAVSTAIGLLSAQWILAISVVLGLVAAAWTTANEFVRLPAVQTGAATFLAVLWTFIGLDTVLRRKKAVIVRTEQDYRYGLTMEGIFPNYIPDDPHETLTFALLIRNFSTAPIKYEIEEFDVRIGNRALPKIQKGRLKGYLPRGGGKRSAPGTFSQDDIKDFVGKKVTGTIEIKVLYGHPEREPVRRLKINLDMILQINPPAIMYGDNITEESDEALPPGHR